MLYRIVLVTAMTTALLTGGVSLCCWHIVDPRPKDDLYGSSKDYIKYMINRKKLNKMDLGT